MNDLETLFFDLDGTLTDPAEGFTRCIAAALHAVGLPSVPRKRLETCIGPPLEDSFRELGAQPDQVGALVDAYRRRYREIGIYENRLYPGIADALESLHAKGHVLHLATSKPGVFAKIILEHFGIGDFFDQVFGSNLDGSLADKSDLLRHVKEVVGFDSERSAMIGDRRFDMQAARSVGLYRVGVSWGYGSRQELESAGAQLLVDRPLDLATALGRANSTNPGAPRP